MKTSNKILTAGVVTSVVVMTITLAICSFKTLQAEDAIRPLAAALDTTTIHIVKQVSTHPESEVSVRRSRQGKLIHSYEAPSAEHFTIVSDTLVVDAPYPVEISLPDVTHLLTPDGTLTPTTEEWPGVEIENQGVEIEN